MSKEQEEIRDWLRGRGYASRYSPKKWSIKVDLPTHTVIIKTMQDAKNLVEKPLVSHKIQS